MRSPPQKFHVNMVRPRKERGNNIGISTPPRVSQVKTCSRKLSLILSVISLWVSALVVTRFRLRLWLGFGFCCGLVPASVVTQFRLRLWSGSGFGCSLVSASAVSWFRLWLCPAFGFGCGSVSTLAVARFRLRWWLVYDFGCGLSMTSVVTWSRLRLWLGFASASVVTQFRLRLPLLGFGFRCDPFSASVVAWL